MNYKLISIKEINSKSSLKSFDCGVLVLNEFLSRYAMKNDLLGIGKTFIALTEKNEIAGYFTLATAQIGFNEIPVNYQAKLPKYPIPSLRIARLAVNKNTQKKGIGKWLLTQAFRKIVFISEIVGIKFIIVDAKETSKAFYEKYGFMKLKKELCYFIPIETVKKAMGESI